MYTNLMLFGLGILGILLHNLMKMNEINKSQNGTFSYGQYLKIERFSILISIVVVVVCLIAKAEVSTLEQFGNYLGLGFVTIGYTAQSLLVMKLGKANKTIEDKKE